MDKIPKAHIDEFMVKNDADLIKFGRYVNNENEFVCTENFLKILGVNDLENSLGKQFKILNNENQTEKTLMSNKTLVGIINDDIKDLDINNGEIIPEIYVNSDNLNNNIMTNTFIFLDVYLDSYYERIEVSEKIKGILPTKYNVIALTDSEVMHSLEGQKKIIKSIMIITSVILIIAVILIEYLITLKSYDKERPQYLNL
jgi:hypothetical protein